MHPDDQLEWLRARIALGETPSAPTLAKAWPAFVELISMPIEGLDTDHATISVHVTGASASDMILSFCSVGQLRRRSTVEMISAAMCLTVLKHVSKDSMLHPITPHSTSWLGRSRRVTLTINGHAQRF